MKKKIDIIIILFLLPMTVFSKENGWLEKNHNKYYYFENGEMAKGITEIEGKRYLLGITTGKLYTSGLAEISIGEQQGIYYTDSTGEVQTGWQKIGKETYYFDETGRMQKGITEVEGKKYLLGITSGKLYTSGIAEISIGEQQGIYYTDSTGEVQTGFQKIGNVTYYFDETGRMQKGITEVEGKKYLLGITSGKLYTSGLAEIRIGEQQGIYYTDSTGEVQTGWTEIDNSIYYFDELGRMQKGIIEVDGNKYLLGYISGKKFIGWATTPDNKIYHTNEEGIIQTGKIEIDGNWYNFSEDGVLQTGWQTINGNKYYFYADGTKANYISKIAGVRYEFSANGELQHSNIKVIADISKHNGTIDWNQVWSSGQIDGVIMRIGYSLGMDSQFKNYLSEVNRLQIPYSVYHFTIAENESESQLEANNLVKWYQENQLSPYMGVFYDIESWENEEDGHNSNNITKEMYDTIISTYKNILNNNGITMSLYTGKYYAENRLSQYARDQIGWIAHYASDCGYKGSYRGWQYTSKGTIPGINGYVDLSIFYY